MPDSGGLAARLTAELDARLASADAALARDYPGERPGRQPVHTVYVAANRFRHRLVADYGARALRLIDENGAAFAALVQDPDNVARVRGKLATEPIEDLRIDFEDGYGTPEDAEEDAEAARGASLLATHQQQGEAAPFTGIRIKSLEAPTRARAVRTLTIFLDTLRESGGDTTDWVVTLPKVTSVDQVEAMVYLADTLDFRFEIQIETPQSILGADGGALVARMVHAGDERLTGLHYGTYDYSAACGIAAEYQSLEHPVADHAKLVMQAATAGTGVRLSDGSTNALPVGSTAQIEEGWATHHRLVRRSLERGYYQGWDLHPHQLPTRYAATYAFYREALPRALSRLADYTSQRSGSIADEPATARALAAYLLRGVDCGAVEPAEIHSGCGLAEPELRQLAQPPYGPAAY